jgi:HK97 family phage major capsid protein
LALPIGGDVRLEHGLRPRTPSIAGAQGVSLQLLEQAPVDFSEIVFKDLIAAHATQLDLQVIGGTGTGRTVLGVDNTPGVQDVAVSSVDIPGFFSALGKGLKLIHSTRFASPEVLLLHPVRFAWLASLLDDANRPLILPHTSGPGFLQTVASQQIVGEIMGLTIVVDSNVTQTAGDSENEDVAYLMRASDLVLWESPFKLRVIPQVKAPNMTVLVQAWNYVAFTAARQPAGIVRITGLTAPSF